MIRDYGELVTEAGQRLGMANIHERARQIVGMAEAFLNRRLRHGRMETKVTLATDEEGWADLPADYIAMRAVFVYGLELQGRTIAQIEANLGTGSGFIGRPGEYQDSYLQQWHGWLVQQGRFRSSEGGVDHDVVYYAALPPLGEHLPVPAEVAAAFTHPDDIAQLEGPLRQTNWLLETEPELYLHAVMQQAASATMDFEKSDMLKQRVEMLLTDVMERDVDGRYDSMVIARRGYNP